MPDPIEELELRLKDAVTQVDRIDALNALAYVVNRSDPKRAQALAEQAQQLSKEGEFAESPYKNGLAESLRTLGLMSMYAGEYDRSLLESADALALAEELGLLKLMPSIYNTMAAVYRQLGDLSASLEYFVKQQQASNTLGDRLDAAKAAVGIGVIYFYLQHYSNLLAL